MRVRSILALAFGLGALSIAVWLLRPSAAPADASRGTGEGASPIAARSTPSVELPAAEAPARAAADAAPARPTATPENAPRWAHALQAEAFRQRIASLNAGLETGTASQESVLELATRALEGLDPSAESRQTDGSRTIPIRACDGSEIGRLTLPPATESGVRPMSLRFETGAHGEFARFDPQAKSELQVAIGFTASGPKYCSTLTSAQPADFAATRQLLQDLGPVRAGGMLCVDAKGDVSWRGVQYRSYIDTRLQQPIFSTENLPEEPRGNAALDDPRYAQMEATLACLLPR